MSMSMNIKIITKIFIILIFLSTITNMVYAGTSLGEISEQAGSIIEKGQQQFSNKGVEISKITDILMPLGKILTTIGVGVILCVGAVMGIKWITANPDEQAKLKQQLIGLAVGAAVIFGSYTIWSIAIDIFGKLT